MAQLKEKVSGQDLQQDHFGFFNRPLFRGADKFLRPAEKPVRISVPLRFNEGEQANAFDQPLAKTDRILDVTLRDGKANGVRCDSVTFTPHCNTTHTESIGHISKDAVSISDVMAGIEDTLHQALLISVRPVAYDTTNDTYKHAKHGDYLITRYGIENAMRSIRGEFPTTQAIIIRCDHLNYLETPFNRFDNPPYFSFEAMQFLVDCGYKHLLTNLPSIDRASDEGELLNHVSFFRMPANRDASGINVAEHKVTNTELCFIPREIQDGHYFLRLGVLHNWNLDAAPAAPLLFPVEEISKEELRRMTSLL